MPLIKPDISNADNSTLVLLAMILDNLSPGGTGIDYTGNFDDLVNNQNTLYQHITNRAGVRNSFSVTQISSGGSLSIPASACSSIEIIPRTAIFDITVDSTATTGIAVPFKVEFDYRNAQTIQVDVTSGEVTVIQRF